ncbi:TPA: hypothetical protein ROX88_001170 [Bacillus pseudomycoides]|nr:hypothetical protein [Bacillus pseudomycoides]
MIDLKIRSDAIYNTIDCSSCCRIAKYVGSFVDEDPCQCVYDVYRCVNCGVEYKERMNEEEQCEACESLKRFIYRKE